MTKSLSSKKLLLIFGWPLGIMLFSFGLIHAQILSPINDQLIKAITLDLVLTMPLVHLFIIRKTKVPSVSVVSMFVLGLISASVIIPKEDQAFLALVKQYALPVVEGLVLVLVLYKAQGIVKEYRKHRRRSLDFKNILEQATTQVLPKPISTLIATEISIIYYCLFAWKRPFYEKNDFTYHKKSGSRIVIGTLLFVLAVEAFAVHVMVYSWNVTAAWILTGLSIYGFIQFVGLMRSVTRRPIIVDSESNQIKLRYGFMAEAAINVEDIEKVELTSRTPLNLEDFVKISSLDSHNIILHLKKLYTLDKMYGLKKEFKAIGFFVDERERFSSLINR